MAYRDVDDPYLINDILKRKEFYSLKPNDDEKFLRNKKKWNNIIPRVILEDHMKRGNYLSLHSYQKFIGNFLNPNTPYTRLLMKHSTGSGKCLSKNTRILMFDGQIKKVQDIKAKDKIMGDDSTPRRVLSITSGKDEMYNIIPVKGKKYKVNQEHILCLKYSPKPRMQN